MPRIPIPETEVSAGNNAWTGRAARASDFNGVGVGLSEIGNAISGVAAKFQADAEKQEAFNVERDVAKFETNWMAERERAENEAPLGAPGYVEETQGRFDKYADEFRGSRTLTPDGQRRLDQRLFMMRERETRRAIGFQASSVGAKAKADADELIGNYSTMAAGDPGRYADTVTSWGSAVDALPGLNAAQRDAIRRHGEDRITKAAALGLVKANPQGVIDALSAPGVVNKGGTVASGRAATFSPDVEDAVKTAARSTGASEEMLRAFAAIESGGNPNVTTGSYKGLFQMSDAEFEKWGSGDVMNPRDNAMAAARKLNAEAGRFKEDFGRDATAADIYLIHQQGEAGYRAHLRNPDQPAWMSMASTGEGQQKGEGWAKQAIWGNLPASAKEKFGSVENVTSRDFVEWWQGRVSRGMGGNPLAPSMEPTGNPILDKLDVAERISILGQANTEVNRARVQARGELEPRLKDAEAAYLTTGEYTGQPIRKAEFEAAYGPEAGAKYAQFEATRKVGENVANLKTMSPQEIAAVVEGFRPAGTGEGYALAQGQYAAVSAAAAAVAKARAEDPAGYAMMNFPAVKGAQENVANATTEDERVTAQAQAYAALNAAYDKMGTLPSDRDLFPKSMVAAETERFGRMTSEDKATYVANMIRTAGAPGAMRGLAQMGQKDPVAAYAGSLMASSPEHRAVAANIWRGLEIMKADKAMRPGEGTVFWFNDALKNIPEGSLDATNRAAAREAAGAIYVAKGGDPKTIDDSLYTQSLREALGGPPGSKEGGYGEVNGFNTILPPMVTRDQMDNWVDKLTEDQLSRLAVGGSAPRYANGDLATVDAIHREGQFVRTGPDRFMIRLAGDNKYLRDGLGRPYEMRITPTEIHGGF